MPSTRPRIALTPSHELKAVLDELAEAMGKTTSGLIVGLLDELRPSLIDLTKIARHTQQGKTAAAKRALQHMVGNAMAEQLELLSKQQK